MPTPLSFKHIPGLLSETMFVIPEGHKKALLFLPKKSHIFFFSSLAQIPQVTVKKTLQDSQFPEFQSRELE